MNDTATMTRPTTGSFSWNELVTPDPKAAAAFYGRLFGWKTQPFGPGGYQLFKTDPNAMGLAGMMPSPHPGAPPQWQAYVVVEDLDASLSTATAAGGKVLLPAMEMPEVGRIAVISDPQGAVLGLHQLAA